MANGVSGLDDMPFGAEQIVAADASCAFQSPALQRLKSIFEKQNINRLSSFVLGKV